MVLSPYFSNENLFMIILRKHDDVVSIDFVKFSASVMVLMLDFTKIEHLKKFSVSMMKSVTTDFTGFSLCEMCLRLENIRDTNFILFSVTEMVLLYSPDR